MILTGKEQLTALDVVRRRALDEDVTSDRAQEDDALCKAQLKKVVEWLSKKSYPEEEGQEFWISNEEWQSLLEEVN